MYNGLLGGNTSQIVDTANNGSAIYSDLTLSTSGRVFLNVEFVSDPAFYDVTGRTTVIEVLPSSYVEPNKTVERSLRIIFDADYSTVVAGKEDLFTATFANEMNDLFPWPQNFTMYNFTVSEGKSSCNDRTNLIKKNLEGGAHLSNFSVLH